MRFASCREPTHTGRKYCATELHCLWNYES